MGTIGTTPQQPPNGFTRDPLYYREDGDCTIVVEDVLFRVHRFLLTRDSTFFQDMYSFPQPTSDDDDARQGTSDKNPITLPGEDVKQFRALCWALYALPTELFKQATDKEDILNILDVAEVADKYDFRSFSTWSMNVISKHCMQKKNVKSKFVETCTEQTLSRLLYFAIRCDKRQLVEVIQTAWISRLGDDADKIIDAITIAENLSLKKFTGQAYYRLLQHVNSLPPSFNNISIVAPATLDLPRLNPIQRDRLLAGHRSLTLVWERIKASGTNGALLPASIQPHTRMEAWQWALSRTSGLPSATDVLSFLKSLRKELETYRWTNGRDMLLASEAVANMVLQLDESLADHFVSQGPDGA